jgi:hypothetical protein
MKEFLTDTQDLIEQLYGPTILTNFPNYAQFWNKFIGVKTSQNNVLLPYGLKFPVLYPKPQKQFLNMKYRELSMSHYSLFCHLAGTRFQLHELQGNPIINTGESYFRHFEHFESCYMHLGTVFYQNYHLWDILFEVKGVSTGRSKSDLKNYLITKRKKYLWEKLEKLSSSSVDLRNNITHFARGASIIADGRCFVPVLNRKDVHWENQWKFRDWIDTKIKAEQDLTAVERFLDQLHACLIDELENYLKNANIKVRY